jgi:integrase
VSKKNGKKVKAWSKDVGESPVLTAYERGDRDGEIWTRIWDEERKKYTHKQLLCAPIRTKGKIDAELENRAIARAIDRQKAIASSFQQDVADMPGAPLTMARARRLMLDPKDGKFPTNTEWKKEITRHLGIIVPIIGESKLVEEVKHGDYKRLWRALAVAHRDHGKYGMRSAEMIVGTLRSLIVWLQEAEHIEAGLAMPAPKWIQSMRREWTDITGKPPKKQHRPRFTKEEQIKLWRALPKADPRLRMIVMIGAELRLGQVARCRRSDIFERSGEEIGGIEVIGRGKKFGEIVVFGKRMGPYIREALETGFLSELEAAYRAGTLEDFNLAQGGFIAKGKAQVENAMMPVQSKALRDWWNDLEELAGVEHMDGRGWYGLRRLGADRAEDVTKDGRKLNKMGGWKNDSTRRRYQDEGRMDVYDEVADIREGIRPSDEEIDGNATLDPPTD